MRDAKNKKLPRKRRTFFFFYTTQFRAELLKRKTQESVYWRYNSVSSPLLNAVPRNSGVSINYWISHVSLLLILNEKLRLNIFDLYNYFSFSIKVALKFTNFKLKKKMKSIRKLECFIYLKILAKKVTLCIYRLHFSMSMRFESS